MKIKNKIYVLGIILLIGFIITFCGKEETEPKCECNPKYHETACTCDGVDCVCTMPQTKKLTGVVTENGTVDVDINYTALLGHTPSYLSTLETVVRGRLQKRLTNGNLTINVVDGYSSFVLEKEKTLKVGSSWLSSSTEDQMAIALIDIVNDWVAMHNANDVIRMAGATVSQLVHLHHI